MKHKENDSVRVEEYLKYLNKYPLYSTLIVLKECEDNENYKECALIKKAIIKHIEKNGVNLPTNLKTYESEEFQQKLKKENKIVSKIKAQNRAKLIKSNLRIK